MRIDSTGWILSEYICCVDGLSVGFTVCVCCTKSSSPSSVRLNLVLLVRSAARSFWNALPPRTSPRAHLRWRLSQFFCTMNKINTADLRNVAFRRHEPLLRISSQEFEDFFFSGLNMLGSVVASRVEQTLVDVKTETPDAQELAVAGPSSADPAVMDVYQQRGVSRPTNWTGKMDHPLERCNCAVNWTTCLRCTAGWRPQSPRRFAWQPWLHSQKPSVFPPQLHDGSYCVSSRILAHHTNSRILPTYDVSLGSLTLPAPEAGNFVELILRYHFGMSSLSHVT